MHSRYIVSASQQSQGALTWIPDPINTNTNTNTNSVATWVTTGATDLASARDEARAASVVGAAVAAISGSIPKRRWDEAHGAGAAMSALRS